MGHFQTYKIGEGIKVEFVEYSENKRISIPLDIMEYDENDYKPKLDLIIGTQIMQELTIVLYFNTNMIEIVQIKLPTK